MVLKEACRYQNVLREIMSDLSSFLSKKSNLVIKTKTHYKSRALKDVSDITETLKERTNSCEIEANDLIDFYDYLVSEKIKLAEKISFAKKNSKEDIDVLVETNKSRQSFANLLKSAGNIKNSEIESNDSDQSFNINGDPITYRYKVKEVTTIDFDRNKVKSIEKRLSKDSNDISNKIDLLMATIEVDYVPIFDMSTTNFEDAYETYKEMVK